MKKVLMLVVVVMAALSVSAQDIRLGGGISLWRNDDADLTSFSITPEIGVELNSKWEIGGELGFAHAKVEKEHYTVKTTGFAIAPFARYSFYENDIVRLFLDMGMGFSTVKVKDGDSTNGFEIGLKPGIEVKLNNKFSLVSKLGFAGYRDDYYKGENGFGVTFDSADISLGVLYTF